MPMREGKRGGCTGSYGWGSSRIFCQVLRSICSIACAPAAPRKIMRKNVSQLYQQYLRKPFRKLHAFRTIATRRLRHPSKFRSVAFSIAVQRQPTVKAPTWVETPEPPGHPSAAHRGSCPPVPALPLGRAAGGGAASALLTADVDGSCGRLYYTPKNM